MGRSEQEYLLELWARNICPNCAKLIPEGTRVGSGKKTEGGFCSLNCFGEYYKTEMLERQKKVLAAVQRHRNS